tara:strand:+ start:845 stop:1738 length:894 start_codon:yes stop_codon:yes gene_type:complete
MKIAVFKDTAAKAGKPVMDAFIQSLQGEDYVVCTNDKRPEVDVVVIWSVLLNMYGRKPIYDYYKNKAQIIVIEVGGLIRNKTWRIGIGGINAEADFANQDVDHVDDSRVRKLGLTLKPWREMGGGGPIVICLQNTKSEAWTGGPVDVWLQDTIEHVRSQSHRPIIVRQHPRHRSDIKLLLTKYPNVKEDIPNFVSGDIVDFDKRLDTAYCVINYNSNPAIEAIMSGVPVLVHESSLCYKVGNPLDADLSVLRHYDRQHWLNKLSYCEWFVDEIRLGVPWRRLRQRLDDGLTNQWSHI